MTHESFNHGLVSSKIWLCEELETVLDNNAIKNPILHVLAGWDNLLSFMLLTRRPKFYGVIHSYDIDIESIKLADEICDNWQYEYPKVYNHVIDINTLDFSSSTKESVFINCSVDQMSTNEWFNKIPEGSVVCLQCTDMPTDTQLWHVNESYQSVNDFASVYKLNQILYMNSKEIVYSHLKYKRHMLIGIK